MRRLLNNLSARWARPRRWIYFLSSDIKRPTSPLKVTRGWEGRSWARERKSLPPRPSWRIPAIEPSSRGYIIYPIIILHARPSKVILWLRLRLVRRLLDKLPFPRGLFFEHSQARNIFLSSTNKRPPSPVKVPGVGESWAGWRSGAHPHSSFLEDSRSAVLPLCPPRWIILPIFIIHAESSVNILWSAHATRCCRREYLIGLSI